MAELSVRQTKFIKAYLKGHNAAECAIIAGYSPKHARKQGHLTLRYTKAVVEYLDRARRRNNNKLIATFDQLVDMLYTQAQAAHSESDRDGMVKVIAELNKMKGYYAPEKKVTVNASADIDQLERITNDILAQRQAARIEHIQSEPISTLVDQSVVNANQPTKAEDEPEPDVHLAYADLQVE